MGVSDVIAEANVKVTGFAAAIVLLVAALLGATSIGALAPFVPYLVGAAILIAVLFALDGMSGGVTD